MERVLVPVDGSPASKRVLEHAVRASDVEIIVLTVINPFDTDPNTIGLQTPTGVPGLPGYSEAWYEGAKTKARTFHEELIAAVATNGCPVTSEVEVGSPTRHIVNYATENDIDRIVIGSHDRTDLSRLLLGSVAERVVRRTEVPVTVV